MSNTFFTADNHFNHARIIKLANRPFMTAKDQEELQELEELRRTDTDAWLEAYAEWKPSDEAVEAMNEDMVSKWNEKVSNKDIVYHLGDFAFARDYKEVERIAQRLNGNIHLIQGNHDGKEIRRARCWGWLGHYKEVKVEDQKIILFHYAQRTWNGVHRGSWMLYGHSHGTLARDYKVKSFDVGVDNWDFKPLSFEEVKVQMQSHNRIPPDQRGWEQPNVEKERPQEASVPQETDQQHP